MRNPTQYKDIRNVIQKGEMYRLASPFEGRNTSWEFVYEDRVVLTYYTIRARSTLGKTCVKLCGLDETAKYIDTASGKSYSGSYLMNVGLYFEDKKDYSSAFLVFQKQ